MDIVKWARAKMKRVMVVDANVVDVEAFEHRIKNARAGGLVAIEGGELTKPGTFTEIEVPVRPVRFVSHMPMMGRS